MLTGTLRDEPLPSTVELVLGGVPGTVVPAKSGIKTASTGVRFTLDAAATIVAVDAWALDTTYAVGDRVHSAGVLFECRTAGDSANGGDGPGFDLGAATVVPGEPANLDDGTVVWWLIGVGTGAEAGAGVRREPVEALVRTAMADAADGSADRPRDESGKFVAQRDPKLDQVAAAQARNKSLSNTAGAAGKVDLTVDRLAKMSDKEFKQFLAKDEDNEAFFKAVNGR